MTNTREKFDQAVALLADPDDYERNYVIFKEAVYRLLSEERSRVLEEAINQTQDLLEGVNGSTYADGYRQAIRDSLANLNSLKGN